ncbi:CarD family transcriptional regulator [Tepidibacillus infernus]|uniref:CarD family transcriptional regulator n=1 Tax=Tepidibacillus decaturensis TaxID=1413211 RepID=A0A135L7E2_9BACI|nr:MULTISPECIES: CarD family transcriptional regulator [Tepidibacillus]KXG44876.1 CarD family transcriptional regulator [Tepidibacillus decaturensis]GBF12010.1 RNA polymerase-binding transcription factor CarD [Tepidibacillus sp. HK-1]
MFNVGDKVVYPMHGAGVIESIEEKEILGEKKRYYIMRIPIGDMKVMIPMNNVSEIGLRQVVDEKEIDHVMDILKNHQKDNTANWNRRYRANLDKMKSGDIYEIADVVRNLMLRDQEKGLSTGEKKMLENAKQILISELVLAKELKQEEAFKLLENIISEKDASF